MDTERTEDVLEGTQGLVIVRTILKDTGHIEAVLEGIPFIVVGIGLVGISLEGTVLVGTDLVVSMAAF